MDFKQLLNERILILDGAMGTMIQEYNLSEEHYRGEQFAQSTIPLKGNNDLLSLTAPEVIGAIHEAYLAVGVDIIESNTFNANALSMADYGVTYAVDAINRAAVAVARAAADKYTQLTPHKPRFVAGSVGPTSKSCTLSPDVNDPAYRALTFEQLSAAYLQQMVVLVEVGVDLLLIETIFDTLNAKAALYAAVEAMERVGREVPIMLSVTLSDAAGRTLSGQQLDAFLASVQHAPILSVGLNCSFGAREMKPFLRQLSEIAPYYVSAYPNAGLPNRFGKYDENPEQMAVQIKEYIDEGIVNIIGGCCGSTPQHLALYLPLIEGATLRQPQPVANELWLSGLERLVVKPENNFVNIGERCNVAGSRKFLRLIKERSYDEALEIARQQVADGAQIIDINMDDGMLDAQAEMTHLLKLIASEPEIARVPLMIDSSKWEVIEAGLHCCQGKCVVNSISLKEGEERFIARAQRIKQLGAAVVVMAFDERGQADRFDRKVEVCQRAYRILVEQVGFNPNDIIFDPNVLAIATGIEEHRRYAVEFIEAVGWIKRNLTGAKVSGGVSNLSFSFRGNNYIREAMHTVFLYHAIQQGMDMGIVNPATSISYSDIPPHILTVIEDVVLDRHAEATERLIELAAELKGKVEVKEHHAESTTQNLTVDEQLIEALVKGRTEGIAPLLELSLQQHGKAVAVIDRVLMRGMGQVGELFGAGKMFLPQVVKSARVMKQAVAILQPYIEQEKSKEGGKCRAGKCLLATVKGDVHDIGKNIVAVVLACNNFEMIDLGVMVSAEEIVQRAIAEQVDFVGLSGLITPSLEEMCHVADEMERNALTIPLMIGGATTSKLHTAVKIAPRYRGVVVQVKDAAQNPIVAAQLLDSERRDGYIAQLQQEQELLRRGVNEGATPLLSLAEARANAPHIEWEGYHPVVPQSPLGEAITKRYGVGEVRHLIDWKFFFNTWQLGGKFSEIAAIEGCDHCRASWLTTFPTEERERAAQAMQLYKDAQRLLDTLAADSEMDMLARFILLPAHSCEQAIVMQAPHSTLTLPTLRQQQRKKEGVYYSLSDFIAPQGDYIAAFATTVSENLSRKIALFESRSDGYNALLLQSLASRLAEATTEHLHHLMRKEYWGYAPEEMPDLEGIIKRHYVGIRPAVGYPSLPDQSVIFDLDRLLELSAIGISLTESGAMSPPSSISGLMFAHPASRYFHIGEIDAEQRNWYMKERGIAMDESERWLSVK